MCNPRNIHLLLLVYTGAAGIQAVAGRKGIRKKKPRGGSRGVIDTQLFRLFDQDEEVPRARGYSSPICMSTLPPGNRLPVDSIVERITTLMKSNSLLANLALLGTLAVAVPVYAKPIATNLPITHNMKVGQTELKAGDYRFLIDGNHLTILNGKKLVAEADGRWEERDTKSEYTAVVSTIDGKLLELRLEGKKSVFVLPQ